jgi:hypothetical protein
MIIKGIGLESNDKYKAQWQGKDKRIGIWHHIFKQIPLFYLKSSTLKPK